MKKDCQCQYCRNQVDEFFCFTCYHNFNECEVKGHIDGISLCPKCYPENDMERNEKIMIYAEHQKIVQELVVSIDQLISSKQARVLDGLVALIALVVDRSLEARLSKPMVLGYIANSWELNDPDTDHPSRKESNKITY